MNGSGSLSSPLMMFGIGSVESATIISLNISFLHKPQKI